MRGRAIGYWATTIALAFVLISGGGAELARRPETVQGMVVLGYPWYFILIIGFWKALAGVALVAPRLPRIKEWAYAGVFFNMTGAAVSHAFAADYGAYAFHVVVTLVLAVVTVASWALRPQSRTLAIFN